MRDSADGFQEIENAPKFYVKVAFCQHSSEEQLTAFSRLSMSAVPNISYARVQIENYDICIAHWGNLDGFEDN